MILTPEQQLNIATTYENAAADKMGVPPQQRAAFARKAKRFRALAQRSPEQAVTVASKEERRQHRFLISAATFLAISLVAATAIRAIMPSALSEVRVTGISVEPPTLTSPSPTGAPGLTILRTAAVPKPLPLSGVGIASMMVMATPSPWPPAAPGFRTLSATAVPEPLSISGENIASMMLMTTSLPQALWDSNGPTSSAITRVDAPASTAPRPKFAKKRIKQKPSATFGHFGQAF